MKRRIARIALVLAAAAILFFYPLIASPAHRIDEAHLAIIRPGMKEAEVEAIFGVPPGAYDWAVADNANTIWFAVDPPWTPQRFRYLFVSLTADGSWTTSEGYSWTWTSRHGAFWVSFDALGRVSHSGTYGETSIDPPWRRWWRQWKGR